MPINALSMKAALATLLLTAFIGHSTHAAKARQHNVVLQWQASVTQDVTYSVYRKADADYSLQASALSVLTWTDTTVQAHQTYTYVVTAVDIYGESAYSNEFIANIPN